MSYPNVYLFVVSKKDKKIPISVVEFELDDAIKSVKDKLGNYPVEFVDSCSCSTLGNMCVNEVFHF